MMASADGDDLQLIHGVFGSGKTTFLAVLILFLLELNDRVRGPQCRKVRVLVSSTTNVAVDRILMAIQALGFDDFVRVGSAKKIAKPILPYSTHEGSSDQQELKDLKDMLKEEGLSPEERECVLKSMQKLKENKQRLKDVGLVGATCAATSFAALDKQVFSVVLLDEACQMTEPTSLLPIARFSQSPSFPFFHLFFLRWAARSTNTTTKRREEENGKK